MEDAHARLRDEDRKVQVEGADEEQHEQDRDKIGAAADIVQVFDEVALAAGRPHVRPQQHQRNQEGCAIGEKAHVVPTVAIATRETAEPTSSATKVWWTSTSRAAALPNRKAKTCQS